MRISRSFVAGLLAALVACGQSSTAASRLKVPVGDSPQRGPADAWALDDAAALLHDAEQVAGLDVAAWQACLAAPGAGDRVAADVALGTSLSIDATPTFVVNGVPMVGAVPESDLRAVIDGARAKAVASGIPRAEYYDKAVLGI